MHLFPISNTRNADALYSQSSESTALVSDPFGFVGFAPAWFSSPRISQRELMVALTGVGVLLDKRKNKEKI